MERRLAAILSADVVGYARLMAEDETATVRTLRDHRDQVGGVVEAHHGRLVDFTGDNFLAEFRSIVEALDCAIEIQRLVGRRNADVPSERRMQFRMGLHVGDVRVEGGALYGTGVNVAARLERLAEPGGICISGSAREQIPAAPGRAFHDHGQHALRNLPGPIQVYRVSWKETQTPAAIPPAAAGDLPSLAVLPFANMSPDPDQEYFADGMAEELINALSRVDGLRVMSRTSSFSFKGTNADVATIGARLNVGAIVEGSVRKAGDRLRITAQLVDVAGGHHLWSESFDRSLDDVFQVQDEIARTIVQTIRPKLLSDPKRELAPRATQSREAYDLYLRASERIARFSESDTRSAVALLESASELDAEFSDAWARLALAYNQIDTIWEHTDSWHEKAQRALARALDLDPHNAHALYAKVRVLWGPREGFRNREALQLCNRCLHFSPGAHETRLWRGVILFHVGLAEQALEDVLAVVEADPDDTMALNMVSQIYWGLGQMDATHEWMDRCLRADASSFYGRLFRPVDLLYDDRLGAAEDAIALARKLVREEPLLDSLESLLWAKRGERERAESALVRALRDVPSVSHAHHIWHYAGATCSLLGRADEAVAHLRRASETGFPQYPLFRRDPHLRSLDGDPGMAALMAELEAGWQRYRAEFGSAAAG